MQHLETGASRADLEEGALSMRATRDRGTVQKPVSALNQRRWKVSVRKIVVGSRCKGEKKCEMARRGEPEDCASMLNRIGASRKQRSPLEVAIRGLNHGSRTSAIRTGLSDTCEGEDLRYGLAPSGVRKQ